jgi:hypothetical protein
VTDREFKAHLKEKRLEALRREVLAEKKPPVSEDVKPERRKKA